MAYLFFDLEFATCKGGYHKICEFGYVLTGEDFSVLERGNFLIDPHIQKEEWDYFALRKIMKRKVSDFISQPSFEDYYEKIASLFKRAELAFGHSTAGDVQALRQECKRWSLPDFSFLFADLAEFYKKFAHTNEQKGLSSIMSAIAVEGEENLHDAETDAFNTMLCVRRILEEEGETPNGFIAKYSLEKKESISVREAPRRKKRKERDRARSLAKTEKEAALS